ncbi:DUF3888 domain-containing protein [Lysinibacillus sp. NPDC097287]|uniref:DUF3888 domain-containing protein n=1 Tax=Lysinibacillus sp. NPDC097287 TaxID=3364144 RepID=UPI00381F3F2B
MHIKKRIFITSLIIMCLTVPISSNAEENYYQPAKNSDEELMMDLFLSVILPNVQTAVSNYYAELLTYDPLVYPYEIKILNMERLGQGHSFQFVVTLEVMPVVGPHISVGKDRITLDVSTGNVSVKEFKHIETYELPPNWQHIKKT